MMGDLIAFWEAHRLVILDIIGTFIGLWYLWLEYHVSIKLWLVGIVMPMVYVFTYYNAGLYADCGMQVYYILATAYGWFVWRFGNKKASETMRITHVSFSLSLKCTFVFAILWLVIYAVLVRFTDSNVPVCDAFINALSIIALWLLAHKYLEQWLVWLVVDAVSCILYVYKGIPFTAGLYGLYALVALLGYWKWKSMMKENR